MTEEEAQTYVSERSDDAALDRLNWYVALLLDENRQQNLISSSSESLVWSRHIADSAQLLSYIGTNGTLMDVGSGPGLPGLVLAILQPDRQCVLVEPRKRRHEWLAETARTLGLRNVEVRGSGVEKLESFSADGITARAFAGLDKILNTCARFSHADTLWALPKGSSADSELSQLPPKQQALFHVEQSITNSEAGIIVGRGEIA